MTDFKFTIDPDWDEIKKPSARDEVYEAGISVDNWASRIVIYGDTPEQAEQLRAVVISKLNKGSWIDFSKQKPEPNVMIDVLIRSTHNSAFQQRVVDAYYKDDGTFVYNNDTGRSLQALPYCHVAYWMLSPLSL